MDGIFSSLNAVIKNRMDDRAKSAPPPRRQFRSIHIGLAGLLLSAVLLALVLLLSHRISDAVVSQSCAAPAPSPTPFVSASSGPEARSSPAYPLKTDPTGRYLVDQKNKPFLIVGDSPQALITNLTGAEAGTFLANRAGHGFNAMWINMLCDTYTGCHSDGSTCDGIPPFTTPGDLSTPNPAYFKRADTMLRMAARYGLVVFLDPIETGGWLGTLKQNGTAKDFAYGVYLGTRYKSFPNIVWLSGNDFQSWDTAGDRVVVQAVARGIKSVDPNRLQTAELNYNVSDTLQDPSWAPLVGLDAAYTYAPTYAEVLAGYNRQAMPVFMVEANYEGENNLGFDPSTPLVLRKQEYWTVLSGAAGQFYGDHYTWGFLPGWQHNLDTIGTRQLGYMVALLLHRPWYRLVPDQAHAVVTAGYGAFADNSPIHSNDYVAASRTPDGGLVLAYMPTARSITVNMSGLSGRAVARWYDPTNGRYRVIPGSPFSNVGAHQFTPSGKNSGGDSDWVLVLEAT